MKIFRYYYPVFIILIIGVFSCENKDRKVISHRKSGREEGVFKTVFDKKKKRWIEGQFIYDSIPVGVHKISIEKGAIPDGIYHYKIINRESIINHIINIDNNGKIDFNRSQFSWVRRANGSIGKDTIIYEINVYNLRMDSTYLIYGKMDDDYNLSGNSDTLFGLTGKQTLKILNNDSIKGRLGLFIRDTMDGVSGFFGRELYLEFPSEPDWIKVMDSLKIDDQIIKHTERKK